MRKGVLALASGALLGVVVACGSSTRRAGFDVSDGGFEASQPFDHMACDRLDCKVVNCSGRAKTTLRGKVYDPAGANALYNVMVYIPGGTKPNVLPPMKDAMVEPDGIACETCSSVVVNPLRSALTNGKGEFVLEDVPVDKDVPIVVQVGKWRRLMHFDVTTKCAENKVPDGELRLPRNAAEGNMPQIAVTTGGADALECLVRGIGIDDREFVTGHDPNGHVHLFRGEGGNMGAPAEGLWNETAQLKKYDFVLLSCEGKATILNKGGVTADARKPFYEYLNSGGKVYATHFHYVWFQDSPAPEFKSIGTYRGLGDGPAAGDFIVNTTLPDGSPFPKGAQMAEWLLATEASSTLGKIPLSSVKNSVQTLNEPAVSWIQQPGANTTYFSFNTPIAVPPERQCGRAVYSDLHITEAAGPTTIDSCDITSGSLNSQQKALEFLFFDLSACVMDDRKPPQPPK